MRQDITLANGDKRLKLNILAGKTNEVWLDNVYTTFKTPLEALNHGYRLLGTHLEQGYVVNCVISLQAQLNEFYTE